MIIFFHRDRNKRGRKIGFIVICAIFEEVKVAISEKEIAKL